MSWESGNGTRPTPRASPGALRHREILVLRRFCALGWDEGVPGIHKIPRDLSPLLLQRELRAARDGEWSRNQGITEYPDPPGIIPVFARNYRNYSQFSPEGFSRKGKTSKMRGQNFCCACLNGNEFCLRSAAEGGVGKVVKGFGRKIIFGLGNAPCRPQQLQRVL